MPTEQERAETARILAASTDNHLRLLKQWEKDFPFDATISSEPQNRVEADAKTFRLFARVPFPELDVTVYLFKSKVARDNFRKAMATLPERPSRLR